MLDSSSVHSMKRSSQPIHQHNATYYKCKIAKNNSTIKKSHAVLVDEEELFISKIKYRLSLLDVMEPNLEFQPSLDSKTKDATMSSKVSRGVDFSRRFSLFNAFISSSEPQSPNCIITPPASPISHSSSNTSLKNTLLAPFSMISYLLPKSFSSFTGSSTLSQSSTHPALSRHRPSYLSPLGSKPAPSPVSYANHRLSNPVPASYHPHHFNHPKQIRSSLDTTRPSFSSYSNSLSSPTSTPSGLSPNWLSFACINDNKLSWDPYKPPCLLLESKQRIKEALHLFELGAMQAGASTFSKAAESGESFTLYAWYKFLFFFFFFFFLLPKVDLKLYSRSLCLYYGFGTPSYRTSALRLMERAALQATDPLIMHDLGMIILSFNLDDEYSDEEFDNNSEDEEEDAYDKISVSQHHPQPLLTDVFDSTLVDLDDSPSVKSFGARSMATTSTSTSAYSNLSSSVISKYSDDERLMISMKWFSRASDLGFHGIVEMIIMFIKLNFHSLFFFF